jgi:hypothetical protein
MKTRNIIMGLACLFIAGGLVLTSCKKDTTPTTSVETPSQQTVQLQNSDAQDAIADKTEEDVDNKLEELQNNGYVVSSAKSASSGLTDTVVITVNHPDSTTFPKVVTLTYHSYVDSSASDNITKDGEIQVTISCADVVHHPRLISRAFTFINFSVTTDSTTIIVNGTRTVNRTADAYKINGLISWARISVTDNITTNPDLKYAVFTTGKTDTLKFTRNVNKTRTAISHYKNLKYKAGAGLLYNFQHKHFVHAPSLDTLTYTGTVTGTNEKNETYTKSVQEKLIITNYKGSLVITSGSLTYIVGTTVSYLITFEQDPTHPHLTLVTAKNNNTGTTKSFDRRLGGVFKKWW